MADKYRGDSLSPVDTLSETANAVQDGGSSANCLTSTKVDGSQDDSSGFKKDMNKNAYSPNTQSFPPSKLVFGGSCKQGSSVLAASRFGSSFGASPFASKMSTFGATPKFNCMTSTFGSPSPKPVYLRPSQLAVGNESAQISSTRNTFPLKPPALGNPFARVSTDVKTSNEEKMETSKTITEKCENNSDSNNEQSHTSKENCHNEQSESKEHFGKEDGSEKDSATPQTSRTLAPPKFMPLGAPSHKEDSLSGNASTSKTTASPAIATCSTSTTTASVTGFVFGENLHERVVEPAAGESSNTSKKQLETPGTANSSNTGFSSSATTNGTSEMLFTSVIKKDHNNDSSSSLTNSSNDTGDKPSKSLSEAAREYEEARAVKRKYEEVAVVTGEEDEANVLQMNCKLFAFDKAGGTWVERGRGTLRLNDKEGGPGEGSMQSRVVIRTTGSLRVVLNTKIWAGMSVDRPSPKSVRLTAMDNTGQIKVFLVMASPKETEQLSKALECRVVSLQQAQQPNSSLESGITGGDLASRSLPPEPSLKKRPSESVEDTGGGHDQQL